MCGPRERRSLRRLPKRAWVHLHVEGVPLLLRERGCASWVAKNAADVSFRGARTSLVEDCRMTHAHRVGVGRRAVIAAALVVFASGCAGRGIVTRTADSPWSPAGQPQFEGVVRLNSGGNTADLTLRVYGRVPGHSSIACSGDLPGGDGALIFGYGIYPQNPHARFPAVSVTVAARNGRPMYAVDSFDSVHTACHPVTNLKLRALAAGEQFSDFGALPGRPTRSLVAVVTVDGRTVTVPLRPLCQHGETQSAHGCVYEPIHWNDQPGFPTIQIA